MMPLPLSGDQVAGQEQTRDLAPEAGDVIGGDVPPLSPRCQTACLRLFVPFMA